MVDPAGQRRLIDAKSRVHHSLTRLCHRVLDTAGVDITSEVVKRSLLVLAPHPDDETLGCGTTIIRSRETEQPVTIVIASDGGAGRAGNGMDRDALTTVRKGEMHKCSIILGDPVVHWLGHRDDALEDVVGDLTDRFSEIVAEHTPDLILSTSPCDPHPDHRAVGRAARRAAARMRVPLLEYAVWQWLQPEAWLRWGKARGVQGQWGWPRLVKISIERDRKWSALSCHQSQLPSLGGSPEAQFLSHFFGSNEYFFPVRSKQIPRMHF